MSAKTVSPTANLLRNSRFFSMPRPLPLPSNDLMGHVQSQRTSDTATLPYPIQQAITTTPSALARGDWGLKRQLPLRSTTKTSTPVFRINAIDTREYITDFAAASDLALNLQKLQELSLSVTTAPQKTKRSSRQQRMNVFESHLDSTDPSHDESTNSRWKFKGPWVAGMTQGDFDTYIAKELKQRKSEFTKFLRDHARKALRARRLAANRHEGPRGDTSRSLEIMASSTQDSSETASDGAISKAEAFEPISYEPTEGEIDDYIHALRNTFTLASELAILIERFLDLPAKSPSVTQSVSSGLDKFHANSQFYEKGPPKTHPSAGISYLKSDAFLDNHPVFGPQKDRSPIEARILQSSFVAGRTDGGKIGVAGIVANDTRGSNRLRSIPDKPDNTDAWEVADRNSHGIGLGTTGGNRIWTHTTSLGIDSRGRIKLTAANANATTVGVHKGDLVAPDIPLAPERRSTRPTEQVSYAEHRQRLPIRRVRGYGFNEEPKKSSDGTQALMDFARQDTKRWSS